MKKNLSWIITLGIVVISFWICRVYIESREALKWPQTKGRVIASSLTIEHLPKFINFSVDPLRWYGTDVRYIYSVGNRTFISNRIAIQDGISRNPKSALKIMNEYRHQHQVIVFYNPADPQQAVLEPANIGDIYIPLVVGGLLAFLWFIIFFDQSVEINTRGRGSCFYRGSVYLQQEQWELAITNFNQALILDPFSAIVYFNRGNAYLGNKQYDKAWIDMQKAMEMGFKVSPEILDRIKKGLNS